MTRRRARWVLGTAVVVLWISWPTIVMADTCKERANAIAGRRVPANVADPDCKRAGVIGATLAVTVAAAAVGVAAVGLGLGLAGFGVDVPTLSSGAGAAPATGEGAGAIDRTVPTTGAGSTTGVPPVEAYPTAGTGTTVGSSVVVEAPAGGASPTVGAGAIAVDIVIASILKGPAALSALERAGLVEPVGDQPGAYRARAAFEAADWQGDRSTGVGGVAYHVRSDGTLDPNIAVGMVVAGPRSPIPDSTTLTTSAPDALNALLGSLPEGELRQAVIELLNPAKLVGMKFDDVERLREDYWDAKQLENPSQAQQTQDYVIYTFSTMFGFSPGAARALLEMKPASWNVLATLVASLG